jgi:hypothetical protein
MNTQDYTSEIYYRLNPLIRVSWSLYGLWQKKDWGKIDKYLFKTKDGEEEKGTEKMEKGKAIHRDLEVDMVPDELEKVFKHFDSFQGYKTEFKVEKKIDDFVVVGVVDLISEPFFLCDYKSGGFGAVKDQLSNYNWGLGGKYKYGLAIKVKETPSGIIVENKDLFELEQKDWEIEYKKMVKEIKKHLKADYNISK